MLKYLHLKDCLICNKIGTDIKNKKNIVLLKTKKNEMIHFNHYIDRIVSHFNLSLDLININDIICRKHINQLNRDLINVKKNKNNNDLCANYNDESHIDDNNTIQSFKLNQQNDCSSSNDVECSLNEDTVIECDSLVDNDFVLNSDENINIDTREDFNDDSTVQSFNLNQQNDCSSSNEDECSLNEDTVLTNDSLVIDVQRTKNSHRYCFVCGIEYNKTTVPCDEVEE